MAALLSRPLSVKFNTYSMKGLSHNEVLLELEKTIPKADNYADENNHEGVVVFLDQTKAFDRVEWYWIDKC